MENQENVLSPSTGATEALGAGASAGSQPQVKGKKIIPAKVISIDKKVYNTIRSFVESSEKKEYVWNTGIYDEKEGTLTFTKPEKWVLIIYTKERNVPSWVEDYTIAVLFDRDERPIAWITKQGNIVVSKNGEGISLPLTNEIELLSTYIIANVEFAVPISFHEILAKFKSFMPF
jgi:hypothetical protein